MKNSCAKKLLEESDKYENTPLHVAAKKGYINAVRVSYLPYYSPIDSSIPPTDPLPSHPSTPIHPFVVYSSFGKIQLCMCIPSMYSLIGLPVCSLFRHSPPILFIHHTLPPHPVCSSIVCVSIGPSVSLSVHMSSRLPFRPIHLVKSAPPNLIPHCLIPFQRVPSRPIPFSHPSISVL